MRKLFLILVWLICLANATFFSDILVSFFMGHTTAFLTNATTKEFQASFSAVMLAVITLILYFYTNVLTSKKDVSIL